MRTDKTWAQLEAEVRETFRKWGKLAPGIFCALPKRSAGKVSQSNEERRVTLVWREWFRKDPNGPAHPGEWREVKLVLAREWRAIDNLAVIAKAVEHMRMADVRELTKAMVVLYNQLYPQSRVVLDVGKVEFGTGKPSGPYTVLHVAQGAPIEVAEAAYRALAKKAHPDAGGTTDAMKRLNAAIEQIRKDR